MAQPNPIGEAKPEILQAQVTEVISIWEEDHPYSSWWKRITFGWSEVVDFLTKVVDYFVRTIDKLMENGPDKKATVLAALEEVYDYIVPNIMPIWLKPFSGRIKSFIFGVIISLTIDFVVGKYRSNEWNDEEKVGFNG